MKAILKFNLPDDSSEFKLAQDGGKWFAVSYDINMWLREQLNHGNEFATADKALEKCRERLFELCENNSVSFDDVE